MTHNKSFSVLGQGFVGGSLTTGMSHAFTVYTYDPSGKVAEGGQPLLKPKESKILVRPQSQREFVQLCEQQPCFTGVYFVAVPTPSFEDGECDTSIVESVLVELASLPGKRIAVIKSTVPPGSTQRWNEKFGPDLQVVHNPEFLTERNAVEDFKNQDRIVLGGPKQAVNVVKQIYQIAYPNVTIVKTSSANSEMVKYFTNCFLATKLSFANEMYQICDRLQKKGVDIDYDRVVEVATLDKRIGTSHLRVPSLEVDEGGNPLFGWALSCFPKDLQAIMTVARQLDVDPKVMKGAWEKNLEVRPSKDWLELKGRAISKRNAT